MLTGKYLPLASQWEHEVVIFDKDTNSTHLIDVVIWQALEILGSQSLTLEAICEGVAKAFDIEDDARLKGHLSSAFTSLADSGLVAKLPG
ncbi:MAG: HPr-rel-A system PqqD family peptide chaperone [Gammaproteobacteria bacterium]|nr:HPr-rel-A system PqqD family peptide chaperone [Gammaproteobacteria bacterium]